jgi:hypothetical protein
MLSHWQDTSFSILITRLFIEPIAKVLEEGNGVANQSESYKCMQQRKWHTLVGSTLVVVSSTLLYINAIYCFVFGWRSTWLNIFVFGINLDSILNDIGMVVLSGILKNASIGKVYNAFTSASSPKPSLVGGEPPFEFNSNAHNEPLSVAVTAVARQAEFQAGSQASLEITGRLSVNANYSSLQTLELSVAHVEEEGPQTLRVSAFTACPSSQLSGV